ncbi:cation transporter [Hazenella sp. IB182357]|uniref:Cation transporter n=1 Tax=Polycladospora coralii TaxID=2771432 RepID=A0A926NG00_9BACL|nr:cation diffusion facilitator family transporter [Polycladospora coralii]MBD1372633.1 cation transporter [Polycladospora coralii]MBS7531259.1 cation transporter [Polycladospora coralii]
MGHHHGHDHDHQHFEDARSGNKQGLFIALCITSGIMFLEFFGGLITNSLALLSDSGHMLSDASSLFLSLMAIWFASKPPSSQKTYGYYRFEILAALFNGITLFIIAGFIMWEAYQRFFDPPVVKSGMMMLIALIGLMANLVSAWILMRKGDVKNNVNLRSAYLHVIGDALGSVGAIIAGATILLFDWYVADPIISVVVAILILKSAWGIINHTVHILMEGTPASIDPDDIRRELEKLERVINVHDLHIWTITSGLHALSCHILIEKNTDHQMILEASLEKLRTSFHIEHATIQIETSDQTHRELKI